MGSLNMGKVFEHMGEEAGPGWKSIVAPGDDDVVERLCFSIPTVSSASLRSSL
jgi:hypothetical protein